jgi:hypothetical protein
MRNIGPHLWAGKAFKDENVNPTAKEKYALLPAFWHGMSPADRRVVMTVLNSHAFKYTPACIRALKEECNLPYSQMNDVRVCVIVSREHPEALDFDSIHNFTLADDNEVPHAVLESNAAKLSLNSNLFQFMLIPKDAEGMPIIKGEELFHHMCRYQNMQHAAMKGQGSNVDKPPPLQPNPGLGLDLYDDSLKLIQPSAYDLRHGAILKDYIGNNAIRKNAKRKLNTFGYVVGHCGVVNGAENMSRMKAQLTMADSMAEISRTEAAEK